MDQEFTTETQCPVCSQWPPADRAAKRELLAEIPLHDPICPRCAAAFFKNTGWPMGSDEEVEAEIKALEARKH